MILQIIKSLVADLNANGDSFEFSYGPDAWNNLLADNSVFPKIHLDSPLITKYNPTQAGYIGEKYPIKLFFMYKSQLEWIPEKHHTEAIDPANTAIRQFITRCQDSPLLDSIEIGQDAIEFINLLDVNVSGKLLFITLKPNINLSVCYTDTP